MNENIICNFQFFVLDSQFAKTRYATRALPALSILCIGFRRSQSRVVRSERGKLSILCIGFQTFLMIPVGTLTDTLVFQFFVLDSKQLRWFINPSYSMLSILCIGFPSSLQSTLSHCSSTPFNSLYWIRYTPQWRVAPAVSWTFNSLYWIPSYTK